MPRRSTSPPTADDPSDQLERLTRGSAGSWRTKDGRFRIEGGGGGSWYLADTERRDQLGMELVSGPYPTLTAARAALTEARERPADASPPAAPEIPHTASARHRQSHRPSEQPPAGGRRPGHGTPAPPSPPPSWIDQLPALERRTVRRTIAALEAAGLDDAEAIVRREHRSGRPEVARAVLLHRLGQLLDRAPDDASSRSVAEAVELLASGEAGGPGLPGWRLVEAGNAARPILLSAADVRRRAKGR